MSCSHAFVDCAGTEVGNQTVGFLDWVAKSSSPTDCFVCSVDDLTTNCVLYPHIAEAVTSSPLSGNAVVHCPAMVESVCFFVRTELHLE